MARQNSIVNTSKSAAKEDEQADSELYQLVGRIVAGEGQAVDYQALAEVLDRPAAQIQATLRKERRKLALALLPYVSRNILQFTGRYYSILDKAIAALEHKWNHPTAVETMSLDDILATLQVISHQTRQIEANVAWAAPAEIQLETTQKWDADNVVDVLSRLSAARHEGEVAGPGPGASPQETASGRPIVDATFVEVPDDSPATE